MHQSSLRPFLALGFGLTLTACQTGGTGVRRGTPHVISHQAPLGVNDQFMVRVMSEQDLSQEYRVAVDGTIDFPYVGRIHVEGREAPDVADAIRQQLVQREVLRNPQVSVMITHVNSRRLSILGQVQHPGTIDFVQGTDIVGAISASGGFTPLASRNGVRVTRRDRAGVTHTFVVHVDEITTGRVDNFDLEAGDIIFVPESIG